MTVVSAINKCHPTINFPVFKNSITGHEDITHVRDFDHAFYSQMQHRILTHVYGYNLPTHYNIHAIFSIIRVSMQACTRVLCNYNTAVELHGKPTA